MRRSISKFTAAAMLGLTLAAFNCGLADADNRELDSDWTVVAMDIDGSAWGVGTSIYANEAIGLALANCRRMSGNRIGCGARLKAARSGWILGLRCGGEAILVAEEKLKDAERAAAARELELRKIYVPEMPACKRLFVVDPRGVVVRENSKAAAQVHRS